MKVQQIPWSAAHEKLLTAHVGRATPDLAQLGNTWVPEFAALRALAPLDARVAASTVVQPRRPLPRHLGHERDRRHAVRRAVVRRHARHLLPPRPAGRRRLRHHADDVGRLARRAGRGGEAAAARATTAILLPLNEWTQPVILGLQAGSPLLGDARNASAPSPPPAFARAFDFYLGLFRDGLAPPVANNEVANLYQEFARGTSPCTSAGPWNLGEFRRRLPAELQDAWATAPLPGPIGSAGLPGVSLAGGASLVVFSGFAAPGGAPGSSSST